MRETRRLRNVNLLYLISLGLIVTVGALMQLRSLKWGLLATELLLIFLPAWLYVRYIDPEAKAKLRLRWPGARAALAGLMVGVGMAPLLTLFEVIARGRFGYALWLSPDAYPTSAFEAVILFLAFAVAPPICEELMFRGVIQPVYERNDPWVGIVAVGLLFAFFHLRLQGLIALLPIAFTLGYVVWRTDSLITGMVTHFGVNAFSVTAMIISSFRPETTLAMPLEMMALALVVMVAGFWLLSRDVGVSARKKQDVPEAPISGDRDATEIPRGTVLKRLGYSWPLLAAAFIYVVMAGAEVLTYAPTSMLVNRPLALSSEGVVTPATWTYEIQDPLGNPIGTATYRLQQQGEHLLLSWSTQHKAFRAEVSPGSVFQSEAVTKSGHAVWADDTLQLVSLQAQEGALAWSVQSGEDGNVLRVLQNDEAFPDLALPQGVLAQEEWPWRAAFVPFRVAYRAQTCMARPLLWSWEANRSEPTVEDVLMVVQGGIPVGTPAGRFSAWQVYTSDGQVAWYDANPPHTLVRYTDGIVTYVLSGYGEAPSGPVQ